jgi:hypothetical protein
MTAPVLTPAGLQGFLSGILDYAGLFPPAQLPLDEAIHHYARYRHDADAWMLARFVIPLARLPELAPYASLFADVPPFRFAVLGTGGPDTATALAAFDRDAEALQTFHAAYPGRVQADVLEVCLPDRLIGADEPTLRAFFEATARRLPQGLDVFFEVPLTDAVPTILPPVLAALAVYGHHRAATAPALGVKFRTGGITAAAFPAPSHLSFALAACRDAGVRFKATAGLHHPVRAWHASVQTKMYGFLNVFGAALLARIHPLSVSDIEAILIDEAPNHFHFGPDGFGWQHLHAPLHTLQMLRQTWACSFGSCSFDEPRDDLRALGWL